MILITTVTSTRNSCLWQLHDLVHWLSFKSKFSQNRDLQGRCWASGEGARDCALGHRQRRTSFSILRPISPDYQVASSHWPRLHIFKKQRPLTGSAGEMQGCGEENRSQPSSSRPAILSSTLCCPVENEHILYFSRRNLEWGASSCCSTCSRHFQIIETGLSSEFSTLEMRTPFMSSSVISCMPRKTACWFVTTSCLLTLLFKSNYWECPHIWFHMHRVRKEKASVIVRGIDNDLPPDTHQRTLLDLVSDPWKLTGFQRS